MTTKDKQILFVLFLTALIMVFLVYEYANEYFPQMMIIIMTYPMVFFGGTRWEKARFDGYLDYLRQVGDLVDNRKKQDRAVDTVEQVPGPDAGPKKQPIMFVTQRRKRPLH